MALFDSKKYTKKILPLISWCHWFTFFNIAAAILLSSLYFFNEASPDSFIGYMYLLTNWVSHMAFLTFMSFVLLIFPLTLLFPHTRFIHTSAAVIFTLGLLLLVLDAFIYSRLGYHLNASSSSQIIDLIANEIQADNKLFWFISLLLFIAILTFEFLISNYVLKHLKQLQKTVFARSLVLALVASFFFSHITHIWADASLDYEILRQDTVLPLSYPLTAKTLLTKYEMFNVDAYIERRTSPLSFTAAIAAYPVIEQCDGNTAALNKKRSAFIILTNDLLTEQQQQQFSNRTHNAAITLNHHIDSALHNDSWFNLLYSLPTIYQKNIVEQQKPLLFQILEQQELTTSFTVIGAEVGTGEDPKSSDNNLSPWFKDLFEVKNELADISSLIFADKLNNIKPGLHLIYFSNNNPYQFELFMDALLLAQKQKTTEDIIWVSSIGNNNHDTSLSIKPALLIWPESRSKSIDNLTSHMDLQVTLLKNWLGCNVKNKDYAFALSNGTDLLTLDKDRIIANTMENGIMVFNKDKSLFIDQNGNFQSYSRQLEAPIMEKSDFPLMIDGVHFIKQFSQQGKKLNKNTDTIVK